MTDRRSRNPTSGRDGFTLLETLVALAVLGLVVIGAAGLSDLLRRVEGRTEAAGQLIERVSAAKRAFRSVVAQAVAGPRANGPAEPFGDARGFTAFSRGPESLAIGAPLPLDISVLSDGSGQRLELGWTNPRNGRRHAEPAFTAAQSISFRYFGVQGAGERSWTDRWDDQSVLPEAIMLRLDPASGHTPFEIVIRTPVPAARAVGRLSDDPPIHQTSIPR